MRSPRVVALFSGAFGAGGGLEMYNRLLVKMLAEGDAPAECEVLILRDTRENIDPRYSGRLIVRTFAGRRWRFAVAAALAVVRRRPDVIVFGHVHFSILALLFGLLRPRAKRWFVTHGVEVWGPLNRIKSRALKQATVISSVSDYTRRQVLAKGIDAAKMTILPCALDPFWKARSEQDSATAPASPVLLTVSRINAAETYKGIEQTLRALPMIVRAIPNVRHVIVGDGDDRVRLEHVARECGVAGIVEFRGRVSTTDLARAYAECSLFVLPSMGEGFGIVFLEAGSFGRAVLGGAAGGTPEVIIDGLNGRLVNGADVEAIATTIVAMLGDPTALRAMGEQGRRRVALEFSWSAFAPRARAVLDGLTHLSGVGHGSLQTFF